LVSTGGHDRKAFFRQLLRGATRAAEEMEALRRATDDAVRRTTRLDETTEAAWHPVPAAPTTHVATLEELRTLCEEAGREEWADEAASLARTGFRLTLGGDGSSWLGGTPRSGSFEWPVWDGVELAFLGRIALTGLPPSALPADGALLLFFAVERAPSGNRPSDAGACRVVHVDEDPIEGEPLYGGMPFAAVTPSAELTLPAAPPLPVLDADELEEWTELRERLAAAQGVELEERAASYHALHRLLGHPDTYAEGMEADAELVSRGVDLDDEPFADVSDEVQSTATNDWTLLLQVSNDDELALDLGDASRLFVWIRRDDLAAGRFDHVHAFVR
jgi:uncharacterized protein YwqG